jgi:hypothetical protein
MSRAVIALALTVICMAGLIFLELTGPATTAVDGAAQTATAQSDIMDAPNPGGDPTKTVATILGRPLFRGDRRPAPADSRGNAQQGDMPRLTGILLASDGRRAIFQPAGKDRAIVVEVGETVGEWRVQDIAADAVTLTGPGGTRRLEPKFAANSGANAPFQQPLPIGGNNGPASGGPLFSGVGAQQNGGLDRPQRKH